MKKLMILLLTLFFASIATAENEAVYDQAASSVEIPILSVKGQSEKFSVTLQQQETEGLVFTITDATPDPDIESSVNEATFDPETGVVFIPAVLVLEAGNPSVKSYSVELQLTEESILEVSQMELILALPTNTFNGVAFEPAGFSPTAKVASKHCTGNPSQNIAVARENFKTKCGEPWNDQKHVCDYKPDGYHCNGNVSASKTPETTSSTRSNPTASSSSRCTGNPSQNIDTARQNFKNKCGEPWNDQKHVCDYKSDGFYCSGNVSASTTLTNPTTEPPGKPRTPSFISVGDVGSYNSVVWRSDRALKGVNVHRNGSYVGSVNMPDNVFNDFAGNAGDRYYLIGYDHNNAFSDRSPEKRAVGVAASVTLVRWHRNVVQVKWGRPSGATSFEIFKNGQLVARTSDTVYVDKRAAGNNAFTIRAVDRYGNRGPASRPAYQPTQLRRRNGQTVTSGQTTPFSLPLTSDREFRGTMTVDPDTGISMEGNVYDPAGNDLGSVTQTHNGSLVETWANPRYSDSSFRLESDSDPMELAGGSTYEKLASFFRSRPPTRPPGGGGGDGGGGDPDPDPDTGPANPTETGPNGLTPSW